MIFVCHVTLQGHVIKAFYDFMVRRPLNPSDTGWGRGTFCPPLISVQLYGNKIIFNRFSQLSFILVELFVEERY